MMRTAIRSIFQTLFSLKTTLVLLSVLGTGAAVATFLENDYGTSTARVLVYYSRWYMLVLFVTTLNLLGVIVRYRMVRHPPRFVFHLAFVFIAVGAAITHFFGQEGIMHIREGMRENRMLSAEPYLQLTIRAGAKTYYQEFPHDFAAIGDNRFVDRVRFGHRVLEATGIDYRFDKHGRSGGTGVLTLRLCIEKSCATIRLKGKRGAKGYPQSVRIGDVSVQAEFGSKVIPLPFALALRDFQLERYPGSMAPSSYASEVTVYDGATTYAYRIYMNHTLTHRHYTFFQSSYDPDEQGTILSINADPGKWPTYIGYFLLALGLVWNVFDRTSRFGRLIAYLGRTAPMWLVPIVMTAVVPLHAATSADFERYLEAWRHDSGAIAQAFGSLIAQSPTGRMEPVNTLDTQLLYKLHGALTFRGLDQDQVLLGMLTRPELWRYAKLLKIKSPRLRTLLGMRLNEKYAAFADAFAPQNRYRLKAYVEQANRTDPNKRGTFEREVIALDEKLNIIYMTFYGNLFRIYPLPNDSSHSWYNPLEAMDKFGGRFQKEVEDMTHTFVDAVIERRFEAAREALGRIDAYQKRYGGALIPPPRIVSAELFYNRLHLFPRLVAVYMFLGLVLLLIGFAHVITDSRHRFYVWAQRIGVGVMAVLFVAHTFGLGLRWYIAGHAPWSDAYESLLYISWSAMLAGLLFFRRSLLVLAATVIIAGIFMFTAHLSNINPQITTLVPVLKSYWLTIHVSVITASYGFLGLGSVLGFLTLVLFVLRDPIRRAHIDGAIYRLSAVNEAALILGLSLLTVGNFIGGVWANESWGRYWGWDPKETWAYVTIVAYTFILHLRLIPRLDRPYLFAVASFVTFSTVLMTYFGVNFYLSGMHSYATGDPVPIPSWVYVMVAIAAVTILAAWPKRGLERLRLPSAAGSKRDP
jgi:cytochrome c-type biogenesis protein CcsB